MKTILTIACALLLAACSHGESKSEPPVIPLSRSSPRDGNLLRKYSLLELNSAANLLKVIADEGIQNPTEDKGTEMIGCPLSSQQALSMSMPLKALIDSMTGAESDKYSRNPKKYSDEHGFRACSSTCSCGVWSDVVEGANEKALPAKNAKIHVRNKQRLSAKASRQSAADSLACARKQSWFCGSDLKSYLQKEADESNH